MAEREDSVDRTDVASDEASTASYGEGAVGPGAQIGPYKLVRILGEGGFGLVYLAQQQRPVKRLVAFKIIKPGMDSRQIIARFEAERQALAILDHPNIAHVFDAGMTETGRLYFVMEYIQGVPITEYCDRERLSIDDRLRLFIPVCEAIQHAHQKGIIHRDLKPSNILVTPGQGRPLPVVIDFGVAKALSQRLTERTLFTEQGQLIGTPEYMSPEQAEMTNLDIDTRSDIYSLGVLLYELLTGVLPFDHASLREAAVGEIQRIIREEEPPRPSTKLSGLGDKATEHAKHRRTEIRTLARRLHRELEWIPLMALRKERDRRYSTASDLARDVENYLEGRPLRAGPESAVYRLRKWGRRHRQAIAVTGLLGVILVASARISAHYYAGYRATSAYLKNQRDKELSRLADQDQIWFKLFLGSWRKDQLDVAETYASQLTNPREKEAASRLLDKTSPWDEEQADFQGRLGRGDDAFWYFILGEWHAKHKHETLARHAYDQCNEWIKKHGQDASRLDDAFVDWARAGGTPADPPRPRDPNRDGG